LTQGNQPEMIQYGLVSSNLFTVLGVQPMLGRTFLPEEDQRGCAPVVILSHSLWQRQFGSDPGLLGKTVTLDGKQYEVIGIMPSGFRFLNYANVGGKETEIWMPFGLNPWKEGWDCRTCGWLNGAARLKQGVTLEQAQTEIDAVAKRLVEQHGNLRDLKPHWRLKLTPLNEVVVKDFRKALLILLGAVGFVLLIACANVANLLLARAQNRQKEFALRAALGASRWRLVRQLLAENIVLAVMGAALGLLVAIWGIDLLASGSYHTPVSPYHISPDQIGIDGRVLLFTLGASMATSLLFGLVPALATTKIELNESLKEGGPQSARSWRQRRAQGLFVVAEVALSVTLLVGAGLLIRSFWRLQATDPGFRAENLLTFFIALPEFKSTQEHQIASFYRQLLEKIETLPGVKSAGAVQYLPLSGANGANVTWLEGPPLQRINVRFRHITPRYFNAMEIPLIEGRFFSESDRKDSQQVAIINEAMARRYWPGANPLGKRLSYVWEAFEFQRDAPPKLIHSRLREIVGVVADIRHTKLEEKPVPELYIPFEQQPQAGTAVVVRTETDPLSLIGPIRQVVLSLDKDQPISYVKTMTQYLSASVAKPRFNFLLMSVFAALALVLAMVGIYGVVSYAVAQRTREIGIRMALGARGRDVVKLVIKQGMWLALIGVGIGLMAAVGLTRLMKNLLFEVSATDPLTFAMIALLLTGVALLACYLPARRATKVDPMIALRCE
ncbi:MAG: ABC transporter permease, partial [Acidobacteria bacterium]|nr:ABC transporter permease [Acidobacteriota bacterium]